jgi:hypothetical protein
MTASIPTDEISLLTEIWKISPTVFVLVVFVTVYLILRRFGLIAIHDPSESIWHNEMERELTLLKGETHAEISELKSRVSHLEGYIKGSNKPT